LTHLRRQASGLLAAPRHFFPERLSMTDHAAGASGAGPSQRTVEFCVAIAISVFALIVLAGSRKAGIDWGDEGPRAGFFPFYVGLVILAASVFNGVQALTIPAGKGFADWGQLRQVLSVVVPTAVYVGLVPFLGIYLSSMLLIAFFMRWLGSYGPAVIAPVAIGVPVAFFIVFERWFLVPLPKGPIEYWLGF
jgi:putative tricarboxylic transport membrane protein